MRLTETFTAIRGTTLAKPFFAAVVTAFLVGAVLSGGIVWKWKDGQAAIQENAQLRTATKAWAGIAEAQRQQHADQAIEFGAAIERLNAISQGREDDREELRQHMAAQSEALEQLRRQRPDLDRIHLGAEFVRHWNAANTGPVAPAAAGPEHPIEPAAAVPGAAPVEGDQSHPPRRAEPARQGKRVGPRLPQQQEPADSGGGRVAGDGMALVLPGHRSRRGEGQGMSA